MNRCFKIFSVVILVWITFSCTERIDIETTGEAPRLSIFGYITNRVGKHTIKITRTAGYFTTTAPEGISNATVKISDGKDSYLLVENRDTAGVYSTASSFYGEENKNYVLDITLDFNNDGIAEKYRAEAHMPGATRVDSIVLSPSVMPRIPNLLLYGEVPDWQKNYLAIYLSKNNEYAGLFEYMMILTDSYFEGYIIDGYALPCVVHEGVKANDTILFKVSSFASDFADFISHARSEAGGSVPLFGGPPVDVETNIKAVESNNPVAVVGYFGAFTCDEKITISDKDY